MRSELSSIMPKEVVISGAIFKVEWFAKVAKRYLKLDASYTRGQDVCDLSELVLDAITLGLERAMTREAKGGVTFEGRNEPYLRVVARNLVHEAARPRLRWNERMKYTSMDLDAVSQSEDSFERELSGHYEGHFKMLPTEELIYREELENQSPAAPRRNKTIIKSAG